MPCRLIKVGILLSKSLEHVLLDENVLYESERVSETILHMRYLYENYLANELAPHSINPEFTIVVDKRFSTVNIQVAVQVAACLGNFYPVRTASSPPSHTM